MNRTEAQLFRACAVAIASAFIVLPAFAQSPETVGSLRHEGDVWALTFGGVTARVRHRDAGRERAVP